MGILQVLKIDSTKPEWVTVMRVIAMNFLMPELVFNLVCTFRLIFECNLEFV